MGKSVVILGAQWGDEGKGKIVDLLTERVSAVARFQGGHNAGHTLVVDGKKTMEIPAQASGYDKLECIYTKMPGWRASTLGATQFDQLPKPAREYLAFIEKEAGAKVGMVSTGPDRNQIIFSDEFAAAMKTASRKV